MFLQYPTLFLALLFALAHSLPSDPPKTGRHSKLFPRAQLRDVTLLIDYESSRFTTEDGKTVFPSHSALYIAGNDQDGPLKIEIADDKALPADEGLNIRVLDLTPAQSHKVYTIGAKRFVTVQTQTRFTNKAFMDPETGKGLVADAWAQDTVYRTGTINKGNINTCNTFLQRLIESGLGGKLTDDAKVYFDKAAVWTEELNKGGITREVKKLRLESADADGTKTRKEFNVDAACGKRKSKRGRTCDAKVSAADDMSQKIDNFAQINELAVDPIASSLSESELALDENGDLTDKAPLKDIISTKDKGTGQTSLARAGGTLTSFTAVGKEALGALGVTGTVAGAVFVILDFVEHSWVGGAIGAVGLAVGIAAGFAVSGPLGWVVGGAIAALFAILPGLFKDTHPPADRTDIQGIIQWKLFGDKDHTGNEQCQKGTPDVPGNKDCQALYGAGTLSMALGFNNFDAIVFLQQFNNGYPITIKDMAAAFYVIDPDKKGDGGDKIATIECHNSKGVPAGKAGIVGADDPKLCNKPEFLIKREMIHLPNIEDTADKVFTRIIPAPNGDCKLIAYPGDQYFPDYKFTMNGLPSAIACGLTAAINVDGTAVPVEGDTNGQKPQTGSEPTQSTDNQGGGFVAPPLKAAFKPLAQTDYVCIIHGTDQPFCLPPGSYHKQSGLGFEIKNVDSLTLPPGGWSLAVHWKHMQQPHERGPDKYTDRTYPENQDRNKKSDELTLFKDDMDAIDQNRGGEATFTVIGPTDGPDPVCCLFTEPKFGGNVWCMGVGGDDVLPQWKDKAQSVSCHNGGQVWLYAKEYGDAGAALVKGNVEDLKDEPYGNSKDTFSKNVKALWVLKG